MKSFAIAAVTILALGSVSNAQTAQADYQKLGFSSEAEMQTYLKIVDVKVTEVPADADANQFDAPAANPAIALGTGLLGALGPVLTDPSGISGWIAFGQKVWEVIVANQPVVNVQTARVTVLPNDKNAWAQMSGWKGPSTSAYSIQFVNGFGATVVNHQYTVSYNYGGQYNGQGRYLANVTIIPTDVDVSWGFTLNSNVEVGQILNTGTVQSPVPAVDLQLKWDVKTILQDSQGADSFYVKGDGSLRHVTQ